MPYTKSKTSAFSVVDRLLRDGSTVRSNTASRTNSTSTTGDKMPGYGRLISLGKNATTDYSLIQDIYSGNGSQVQFSIVNNVGDTGYGSWSGIGAYENGPGAIPADDGYMTRALSQANAAFASDVRNKLQSSQAIVSLGELAESKRMISNRTAKLFSAVMKYGYKADGRNKAWARLARKLRGKTFNQHMQDLASLWLESSFGWGPLIGDINDAAETYRRLNGGYIGETVNGKGTHQTSSVTSLTPVILGGAPWFTGEIGYRVTHKVHIYGRIASGINLRDVSSQMGTQFSDFVPSIYELIPYSFLVDYFSNVGDIVNSIDYSSANVAWASATFTTTRASYRSAWPDDAKNLASFGARYTSGGRSAGGYTRSLVAVNRVRNHDVAVPSLYVEIPSTLGKALNIAALATVRGLPRGFK